VESGADSAPCPQATVRRHPPVNHPWSPGSRDLLEAPTPLSDLACIKPPRSCTRSQSFRTTVVLAGAQHLVRTSSPRCTGGECIERSAPSAVPRTSMSAADGAGGGRLTCVSDSIGRAIRAGAPSADLPTPRRRNPHVARLIRGPLVCHSTALPINGFAVARLLTNRGFSTKFRSERAVKPQPRAGAVTRDDGGTAIAGGACGRGGARRRRLLLLRRPGTTSRSRRPRSRSGCPP
jgi:hypothetical protein